MALRYVLTVLVAAATSLASQEFPPGALSRESREWPCPIQAEIAPCRCSQDTEYNLYMDCSQVSSDEALEVIFGKIFPFKDFYELKIDHNPDDVHNVIDAIRATTFADISFERIIITGTRLTDIIDEAFANSHNTLKYLDLSNNFLHTFPFESLALYTELHTFILDDNEFPVLYDLESLSLQTFSASRNHLMKMNSANHFRKVPSLRDLYLSEIGLQELQPGLFNNLTKLEVVDFSKNHLSELEIDSIRIKEPTLKRVNFDYNNISFVRHDSLWGFREDGSLSMAENKITELEEQHWKHIFQQITYRETIDLRGNILSCGCDIDWLFMQYDHEYLCRLTDTSRCGVDAEQVIFLDVNIYCTKCATLGSDCPPQTDCKNPSILLY